MGREWASRMRSEGIIGIVRESVKAAGIVIGAAVLAGLLTCIGISLVTGLDTVEFVVGMVRLIVFGDTHG